MCVYIYTYTHVYIYIYLMLLCLLLFPFTPSACLCMYAWVFILHRTGLLLNPAYDLPGLDAPLQQYPTSAWHLSGMDLLQLTSKDLEILGVNKIGHQELILEAVEKLCFLVSGARSCASTCVYRAVFCASRWCLPP